MSALRNSGTMIDDPADESLTDDREEELKKERHGRYVEPEERAARMVRRMDKFLRKGPRKGLNYQKWQQLAYYEAVDEIKRAEMAQKNSDSLAKSAFLALAVGLGTIAFWVMMLFFGNQFRAVGIGLCIAAGAWVYYKLQKADWFS